MTPSMLRGKKFSLGKLRSSKWTKVLGVLLLVFGLGWAWQWYNAQPVVGILTTSETPVGEVKAESVVAPGRYKSDKLTFAYPGIYTDNRTTTPSGAIVEQFSLAAHLSLTENRRISVMVKHFNTPSALKDDSAYQFRSKANEDYQLSTETTSRGLIVSKFVKEDGSEVTYFVPGTEYFAIVASSSSVVGGEFMEDVQMVINSFSWD